MSSTLYWYDVVTGLDYETSTKTFVLVTLLAYKRMKVQKIKMPPTAAAQTSSPAGSKKYVIIIILIEMFKTQFRSDQPVSAACFQINC